MKVEAHSLTPSEIFDRYKPVLEEASLVGKRIDERAKDVPELIPMPGKADDEGVFTTCIRKFLDESKAEREALDMLMPNGVHSMILSNLMVGIMGELSGEMFCDACGKFFKPSGGEGQPAFCPDCRGEEEDEEE
jgi:hypothetical protein